MCNSQSSLAVNLIVVAFCTAALLSGAGLAAGRQPGAHEPAKPSDTGRKPAIAVTPEEHQGTRARHERFNEISKHGEAKLVFLGDSITEGWEGAGKAVWAERYARRHAANFGIGGDRTEHVLWRLDHGNFDGLSPKLIVMMIGTNNTGHRMDSAADTAAGIRAIIDRLKAKCPKAKILLLGIFPRGEDAADKQRQRNAEINAIISRFDDQKTVFYRDIGSAFLEADAAQSQAGPGVKGGLKPGIMPDKLHLNEEGYRLWADAIEADVARLLDEPSK